MQGQSLRWSRTIAGNLLLTLTYALTGYLALLLSIAPGYVAAVFPPSGIALAALLIWGWRLTPGIWLGAVVMSGWILLPHQPQVEPIHWLALVLLGTGATLKALLGKYLIQRFVSMPLSLSEDRSILRFLVLGGPVACMVSATIGVTALWLAGVLQYADLPFGWWTWWTGDSLGVLLFAPVMLALFGKPNYLWRRRRTTVALPLLLTMLGLVFIFFQTSRWENERILDNFNEQAQNLVHRLETQLAMYEEILSGIERLFAASDYVGRNEFLLFVAGYFDRYPGLQALEWLPSVHDAERAHFEAMNREEGLTDFIIRERDVAGQLVTAAQRALYFPVTYVAPMKGNEPAIGYDVFSDAQRRAALESARDTGRAAATAPTVLVQEVHRPAAMLVFQPVYRHGADLRTPDARRAALEGMLLMIVRIPHVVETIFKPEQHAGYSLAVIDVTDSPPGEVYYGVAQPDTSLSFNVPFAMAGRQLKLVVTASADYVAAHRQWQAWTILAVGLFATSLLGGFLLSVTGRAEATSQLVEQRTRELQQILDNALDVIITLDAWGIIQSANPAAEKLFLYAADEMIGRNIGLLIPSFLHAQPAEPGTPLVTAAIFKAVGHRRETTGLRKDGVTMPLELGVSEVRSEDKVFFTVMVHDLTERRRVEKLQGEFISIVSHELRTPLTSIRGALGLLADGVGGPLPGNADRLVQLAASNAERLTVLVNDILDVGRLEASYPQVELRNMDLIPLLSKAVEDATGYARQCDVRIVLSDTTGGSVQAALDPDRFQQVMANLLSNAIKYSPRGDCVEVSAALESVNVHISVADHGPGVPEEFRSQVFKKFARADTSNSRRMSGTGLGLSIAKAIVEKMGGSIDFDTTPGRGATFHFTLPVVQVQTRAQPQAIQ